jgi:murein DD-endopeptidase MepM/ murein hydrolase activator NlpD
MKKTGYKKMRNILMTFIVLFSCADFSYAALPSPSVRIEKNTIKQGETLAIEVIPSGVASTTPLAWVGSRRVWLFPYGGKYIGFYSAPAKAIPAIYRATVVVSGEKTVKVPVVIKNAKFPVTKLVVTEELNNSGFTSKNIASNLAEADTPAIIAALAHPAAFPYFSGAFGSPLKTVTNVGAFGNYRKSGMTALQHLGTDLEAAMNTPVYAINDGVVTMAKRLTNYGNSIVVDHGAHIFSMYLHLDRFAVYSGDTVKKGDILGYSGNTGYSIAPHLHLSINVNGTSIDPLHFIETTQSVLH